MSVHIDISTSSMEYWKAAVDSIYVLQHEALIFNVGLK